MKKTILSLTMGAALLIAPMTASALTPMTADSLKDATGQAGVSIALDDITLYQYVGSTTYTDTDGIAGVAGDAAGIVISDKETLTTLRAILDHDNRDGFIGRAGTASASGYGDMLTGAAGTIAAGTRVGASEIEIAPLSIDVAAKVEFLSYGTAFNHRNDAIGVHAAVSALTGIALDGGSASADIDLIEADLAGADPVTEEITAKATAMYDAAMAIVGAGSDPADIAAASFEVAKAGIAVAGVVIGLPTIEICKTGDTQTISLSATGSNNDGAAFIQITKEDSVMAILGGTVEIAAH